MEPIDASTTSVVTDALGPERTALLALLARLDEADWDRPTECPAYSVKGIATHILGDDLSLLSRQRDGGVPGLILVAENMPGVDFRTLLNTFNDRWVEAAQFLSPTLLLELLRLSGDWTAAYYGQVEPSSPSEPVAMFEPSVGGTSPIWQAIAREFVERWVHHSQIRRALGQPSLAESPFLGVGIRIVGTAADASVVAPTSPGGDWTIGQIVLGDAQQAADILTLAFTEDEVRTLTRGPSELVARFASRVGRRTDA